MTKTLQQKIDALFNYDANVITNPTVFEQRVNKTIQELREEISNLLLQYKNNYTNCEMIGYENSYLKGRIESLKDVLALIGEKK